MSRTLWSGSFLKDCSTLSLAPTVMLPDSLPHCPSHGMQHTCGSYRAADVSQGAGADRQAGVWAVMRTLMPSSVSLHMMRSSMLTNCEKTMALADGSLACTMHMTSSSSRRSRVGGAKGWWQGGVQQPARTFMACSSSMSASSLVLD